MVSASALNLFTHTLLRSLSLSISLSLSVSVSLMFGQCLRFQLGLRIGLCRKQVQGRQGPNSEDRAVLIQALHLPGTRVFL